MEVPKPPSSAPARRHPVTIPVLVLGDGLQGTGLMQDLSASGGLVVEATRCPPIGMRVRIRLLALGESLRASGPSSMDLEAEVVRLTDTGFGVRFTGDLTRVSSLLDRALSRTPTP